MPKPTLDLLNEGKPFCSFCEKQRGKSETDDSEVRPVDMEENHSEDCPYRKKLVLQRQLWQHSDPVLAQEACDYLDGLSHNDYQQILDELVPLWGQPDEIIHRIEELWAPQFGRC